MYNMCICMHVCMKKYVYWVYGWFQDVQRRFCAGMLLHIGLSRFLEF